MGGTPGFGAAWRRLRCSPVCLDSSSSSFLSSLEFSDAKVYEPKTRALLGTTSHFCELVVHRVELPCPQLSGGNPPYKFGHDKAHARTHEDTTVDPVCGLRPARPGRTRLGMTLEPLLGSAALDRADDPWNTSSDVSGYEPTQ